MFKCNCGEETIYPEKYQKKCSKCGREFVRESNPGGEYYRQTNFLEDEEKIFWTKSYNLGD